MLTSPPGPDAAPATLPAGDHSRFRSVAVVGAGLMGRRLAGVFASRGLRVALTDWDVSVLPEASRIAVELSHALGDAPGPVRTTTSLEDALDGVDLVTEAAVEDLSLKRELFARMARLAPDAVLASNSSVLPITMVAADIDDPSRAVGTHWWNPPDLIPIVEVVQGERTSLAVVADVMALLDHLGKRPVWVRRDVPGFVGNRLQHALWREAIALVAEGVADAETVDLVVRDTIGLRLGQMGPLTNADYVGLDLTRAIHEAVFPALDRSTEPSPVLDSLIRAGRSGAKSGQGLFAWPPGAREAAGAALASHITSELAARRGESGKQ
ncbi:3-hydroxyacyl-CoA dehydrogenase NAD-binding domain-containing protein [Streptomyces sp. NPDC046909]|uniref:3-hydroxyacyl-CoA dehydrogenase family protein n=1 Tax=Streptomyces sp. NPDC046909 TaxID=3155617 RepID=UPI0033FBC76E